MEYCFTVSVTMPNCLLPVITHWASFGQWWIYGTFFRNHNNNTVFSISQWCCQTVYCQILHTEQASVWDEFKAHFSESIMYGIHHLLFPLYSACVGTTWERLKRTIKSCLHFPELQYSAGPNSLVLACVFIWMGTQNGGILCTQLCGTI